VGVYGKGEGRGGTGERVVGCGRVVSGEGRRKLWSWIGDLGVDGGGEGGWRRHGGGGGEIDRGVIGLGMGVEGGVGWWGGGGESEGWGGFMGAVEWEGVNSAGEEIEVLSMYGEGGRGELDGGRGGWLAY